MGSEDLINFDIIEAQKENIQALPSGRSARKLAEAFAAPSPLQPLSTPTPSDTRSVNDCIRAEYEAEVANISESDDPLDVYDRYVRWTLDAYPSAQATPQSQLHILLERATKAFVGSAQYKDDARYLKIWLHYINFFSDAPRETFVFLSRHGIGEALALFYEEYAAWLEGAGRWAQSEEVYKLGIERDARPVQRLIRKFGEFEARRTAAHPDGENEAPASPALPTVRPALAMKVDPLLASLAAAERENNPQGPRQGGGVGGAAAKPAKKKLAIFSDADAVATAMGSSGTKGWDSIGSLVDRKKENVVEARPWAGETLKAGGKKTTGAAKLAIFRDPSLDKQVSTSHIAIHHSHYQVTVNPSNGKKERVFVDLRAVYPTPDVPGTELSFEEIWAANRGWLGTTWEDAVVEDDVPMDEEESLLPEVNQATEVEDLAEVVADKLVIHQDAPQKLAIHRDGPKKLAIHQDPPAKLGLFRDTPPKMAIHRDASPKLAVHMDTSEKMAVRPDVLMLDENGKPIYPKENKLMLDENGAPVYSGASKPRKKKAVEENRTQIITVQAKLDSPSGPKMRKKNRGAEPTMTMHTAAATDDIYDIFNQPLRKPEEDELSAYGDDYDTEDYTSGAESTRNIATSEAEEEEEDDDEDDEDDEEDEVAEDAADDTSDVKSASEWSDFSTRRLVPGAVGEDEDDNAEQHGHNKEEEEEEEPEGSLEATPEPEEEGDDEYDDDSEVLTPVKDSFHPRTRTSFVPIPPEDYVAPTRPYRDPIEAANNRLPFMTPITERTETSLNIHTDDEEETDDIHSKSPSRRQREQRLEVFQEEEEEDENNADLVAQLSSPLREVVNDEMRPFKIAQPLLPKPAAAKPTPLEERKLLGVKAGGAVKKGPIISDAQCNPVDSSIRNEILANIRPPLASYDGFHDHRTERHVSGAETRKYFKAQRAKNSTVDKTGNLTTSFPPNFHFPDTNTTYTIKKELGAGAFAPVYLVETSFPSADEENDDENQVAVMNQGVFAPAHNHRRPLEALKMEDPPSSWEFFMMRLAHARLGPHHRASASLSVALECHLYSNEGFLFLPFHPHGSLLDVVNLFRGEPNGVMDELLAAFFTVELLRTVEALHAKQILHGDLKADNCLLRLDGDGTGTLGTQYSPDGEGGWSDRGVTLIDFGRGIDMRVFRPDVQFIADWKTGQQECAEMREGRPWTWQIDYHGLAGIVHCLLFGKYIETVRCDAGGLGIVGGRKYRIRESLKRYWQTEMWGDVFELLLNPGMFVEAEEGAKMPVLKGMRRVRERMEGWLEGNCERGVGLKGLMGKVEQWARGRR